MRVPKNGKVKKPKSTQHDVHVLSLDGGGSRGLMELFLLDHIMNLATVMVKNPKHIITLLDKLDSPYVHSIIKSLIDHFEGDPIHPTSAFQYLVGKLTVNSLCRLN